MKFRYLLIIPVLCASVSLMAATNITATITKFTTLTGSDAKNFQKTFGKSFNHHSGFRYSCKGGKCKIRSTKEGFSGDNAKAILHGRKFAKFVSADKRFQLDCGHAKVAFCNVIQKGAVLN